MTVDGSDAPAATVRLPQIRRLRVCLLGGDSCIPTIGKADAAAAFLRGLTADAPTQSDPALDFAFDFGVFERAWHELMAPPTVDEDEADCDRWGYGALQAWQNEGRIHFDRGGQGKTTPPYDPDTTLDSASLCAGNADTLGFGHKRALAGCIFRGFRDALGGAGQDVDAIATAQKEVYKVAEASPRQLVRKDRPCAGLLATFARFSPEAGAFHGCGAAFVHIFEPGFCPFGAPQNAAMMYACAPNCRMHEDLTPGKFLSALYACGSNIARTIREYNWLATDRSVQGYERSNWLQLDLKAHVECLLSDKNLLSDMHLRGWASADQDGWLNLEAVKGNHQEDKEGLDAKLLDALSESTTVETKVAEDGTIYVRRHGGKPLPQWSRVQEGTGKGSRRKFDPRMMDRGGGGMENRRDDPTCWDLKRRGHCPRGDKCPYLHALGDSGPTMTGGGGGGGGGGESELCWDIMRKGRCARGANCRYIHPPGMGTGGGAGAAAPAAPPVTVPPPEGGAAALAAEVKPDAAGEGGAAAPDGEPAAKRLRIEEALASAAPPAIIMPPPPAGAPPADTGAVVVPPRSIPQAVAPVEAAVVVPPPARQQPAVVDAPPGVLQMEAQVDAPPGILVDAPPGLLTVEPPVDAPPGLLTG
eukprot:TRINITY_DN6417_c0_g1_i1.p1 TRINITY_DN6417_c0_g1~~TRINITY_DN6417_c0_g1_i1.p1  ORF type:complete len:657 (-),score=106.91 TRINITY_DN6417_c0_g1_i1:114-2042(-)